MMEDVGIQGKVKNEIGQTSIIKMSTANVPCEVMCQITEQKNLNSLDYCSDLLEVVMRTIKPILRATNQIGV